MNNHIAVALAVAVACPAVCWGQDCTPYWNGLPSLGSGITFMQVHEGALYVQGSWGGGATVVDPVRRWDGHQFIPAGSGLRGGNAQHGLSVLNDGEGARLYYLATTTTGARELSRLTETGDAWEKPPTGMFISHAPLSGSFVLPTFSTGTPGAAGLFGWGTHLVMEPWRLILRWSGGGWKAIGHISSGAGINRMAAFNTDGMTGLFLSGGFQEVAGVPAQYLARWDGRSWHGVGACPGAANAMVVLGGCLYIGYNSTVGEPALRREGIARWTGAEWVSVGGGVKQAAVGSGVVNDMVVFDDGTGPAIFVCGAFDQAGQLQARNIAKWDGENWSALGQGIAGGFPDALAVVDDGRGPSLFVSGSFTSSGGGQSYYISQWVGCQGSRQCYADCDNSGQLSANDFVCFITKYATANPFANCDVSEVVPAINASDFVCFLNRYVAGCRR